MSHGAAWLWASCVSLACASPRKTTEDPLHEQRASALDATLSSALASRFPAADAAGVCPDAQLRLRFAGSVKLGQAGTIRVFDAARPQAPVDRVDLEETDFGDTSGGRPFRKLRPLFVEENEVIVSLRAHALQASRSYFVTVEPGVFLDERGASLGALAGSSAWRFTTAAAMPRRAESLRVAADGSGDFCSVQGAIDSVPEANTSPVTISLKNGTYREILLIANKHRLTLRGEDRKRTQIAYANNDNLQQRAGSRFRALVSVENSNQFTLENLTLHNLTTQQPPGGSGYQAEALRVEGSHGVVLRNAEFISRQDTLQLSGSVYVVDSYVEGNVDYVWGKGVAYFERCELKTVARSGYLVQSRNAPSQHGYVFVDSKLTANDAITGAFLARIDVSEFPGSSVAFVDCQMGPHIDRAGWLVTGATPSAALRFWEYGSRDLDGRLLDVNARHPASRRISEAEARALRDRAAVLGWDPSPVP